MIWQFLHLVDVLLWLILAGSVLYVTIFALTSLLPQRKPGVPAAASGDESQNRFLVLFPAYKEDKVICHSVEAFLHQTYPAHLYQVIVISDSMQAATNHRLSTLPITLLQPAFERSSKARALQYAITLAENGGQNSKFTHVVILDADNIVQPTFLSQLSDVCDLGYRAIQCHRMAKNDDNDIAVLDGVSEEINNTLFRRAHNAIGLSSALIGSGMCFDYQWFCDNVNRLETAVEDRELETLLMKQGIFIKYEHNIHVLDEKVSSQDNFQRQRLRWMTGQVQALLQMLPYLPTAFRQGNVNYVDKTLQQALIPRSILLVVVPFMSLLMTLLAPVWSVKWWIMLVVFCVSLFVAIPSELRTKAIFGHLVILPRLVWRLLKNIARIDRKNTDFIHTTHDK